MTAAESRRHDLYTGLADLLGEDRADTLMAYLPTDENTQVAMKADLETLEVRMDDRFTRVDEGFAQVDERFNRVDERFNRVDERFDRLESRMDSGFASLNARIDRMNLTLTAGMLGVIAALIVQSFI